MSRNLRLKLALIILILAAILTFGFYSFYQYKKARNFSLQENSEKIEKSEFLTEKELADQKFIEDFKKAHPPKPLSASDIEFIENFKKANSIQ